MKRRYFRMIKSKYFFRSFCICFVVILVILIGILAYIYADMQNLLNRTYQKNDEQTLITGAQKIDYNMSKAENLVNTIDANPLIKSFFIYDDEAGEVFLNQTLRIREYLNVIEDSNDFIESVVLYSGEKETVFTSLGVIPIDKYTDNTWLDAFYNAEKTEDKLYVNRAIEGRFPFVISIIKPYRKNIYDAAIVININLAKMCSESDMTEQMCIVSEKGKIIFRNGQRQAEEELIAVEGLDEFYSRYKPGESAFRRNSKGIMCTFSSYLSEKHGWSYVRINPIEEFDSSIMRNRILVGSMGVFFLTITFLIAVLFTTQSYRPIEQIMEVLRKGVNTNKLEDFNTNEVKYITSVIVEYMQFNKELSEQLGKRLGELNRARLDVLKFQINPHFMFNTLNAIRYLEITYLGYEHKVPEMTLKLCELLRYALEGSDIVSVVDEIEYINKYVSTMNLRYDDKIKLNVSVKEGTSNAAMPKLLIQPIVENSIIHGMKEGELTVNINIYDELINSEKYLVIRTADNGCGIEQDKIYAIVNHTAEGDGSGIGLSNIINRVRLIYAEKAFFEINSNGGTEVIIRIPYIS